MNGIITDKIEKFDENIPASGTQAKSVLLDKTNTPFDISSYFFVNSNYYRSFSLMIFPQQKSYILFDRLDGHKIHQFSTDSPITFYTGKSRAAQYTLDLNTMTISCSSSLSAVEADVFFYW